MKRLTIIASLLCLATSVHAQIEQDSVYSIPELVIAAPKVAVETATAPVYELDKTAISSTTSQSVANATKFLPGVLVKDYGGVGGLKTVSVRGLGAEHTAVFWDGIKVSSEQSGQVDMGKYPVSGLESISLSKVLTVEKAASATAYASAAVLEMNSVDKIDSAYKLNASLQYGSLDYLNGQIGLQAMVSEETFVSINSRFLNSEGDYKYRYENGANTVEGNRNNSSIQAGTIEGNFNKRLGRKLKLKTKLFYNKAKTNLPGAIVFYNAASHQQQKVEDFFGQATLNYRAKKWELNYRLKAGYNYLQYQDPDFLNSTGGIDDQYKQNEVFNSLAVNYDFSSTLSGYAASDLVLNSLNSNVQEMPSPLRITTRSVIGLRGALGKFSWNTNVLFTHFQEKEDNLVLRQETPGFTPTVGLKYDITNSLAIRASYKETYRLPTFNELYYVRVGNQDLVSERADLWNAGVVYQRMMKGFLSSLVLTADVFYQHVNNKIIAIPTQNLFVWSMQNIGKVASSGIDWSCRLTSKTTRKGAFYLTGNYTYQKALDITNPEASSYKDQIPYVPFESGSAIFSWKYKQFTLGYSAVYSGFRYAMAENIPENVVDAWSQHDVVLSWTKQLKKCVLTFRAEALNITDKNYDVIRYYPMPGRQWRGSLSIEI